VSLSPWEKHLARWMLKARPVQRPPVDEWTCWFIRGGRGSGKTTSGAEWASRFIYAHPSSRFALVAPTFGDGRDTMVEGETGVLEALPDAALRGGSRSSGWNRSMGELYFANGAKAKVFSSEKAARLRGPQHHGAWVDEPGVFEDARRGDEMDTTWSNLMLGLRLGTHPQVVVTGTPKPVELVRHIMAIADHESLMSTYDNLPNLAPAWAEQIIARYKGTRLERQELLGELLGDVEGALWTWDIIDPYRVTEAPPLVRVVVGVDPSASSGPGSAETGIITAGIDMRGHVYVTADDSLRAQPEPRAAAVGRAFDRASADVIVAEANNGGDMVGALIRAVRPDLAGAVVLVHASRGKATRADPVAALYAQGKVHHLGGLGILESQLTSWVPGDPSPDRLDSCVWAISHLMTAGGRPMAARRPSSSLTADLLTRPM